MALQHLEHYTVNTDDVDATVAFYEEVLGLSTGPRPPFEFPGAWIYCGDIPVVHLIGDKTLEERDTGTLDHVAFRGSGVVDFVANLDKLGIPYRERDVPATDLHQVFVDDPNGVTIEINFRGELTA